MLDELDLLRENVRRNAHVKPPRVHRRLVDVVKVDDRPTIPSPSVCPMTNREDD